MRIINEAPRFKQQLCRSLLPYPPLLKKFPIPLIATCPTSGDNVSPQARR